ncbi:MAG: 50S ribosomal protein L2 [Patescibacteria group bacterium]|nr:MAG: 50S ribosomal protein L2 [Patescibacteria group bacterium]
MPIKSYRPITFGRRGASVDSFEDVTKKAPEKSLLVHKKRIDGRNSQGKITVRHRGGGAKRMVRVVDFMRSRYDIPAKVAAIEYDPGRGGRLALLNYVDGVKSYILAPANLKVGETIVSSQNKIESKNGNRMPLKHVPIGLMVHDIELYVGSGGKMVRGAGNGAQLMAIEGDMAQLKLPSGEYRMVSKECAATIGVVSNPDHWLVRLGKAGRMRHKGFRPRVRGKVMNPVDHPHGGGEGKNAIGLKHPKTPWGKPALGVKTRKHKKQSSKFIVKRRK